MLCNIQVCQFSFVALNESCLKLHFSSIYHVQLSLPSQISYFHCFACWSILIVAKTNIITNYKKKDKKKRNILVIYKHVLELD